MKGPRFSSTIRCTFGGRGIEIADACATNALTSEIPNDTFSLRSAPIVEECSLDIEPPQSDPATWPG